METKRVKRIIICGTAEEVVEQLKMLEKKYGKDAKISEITDDPFLWVEP